MTQHRATIDAQNAKADAERGSHCEACDGSGVILKRVTVYEHGCGFSHCDTDERQCEECGGTGYADSSLDDFQQHL